MRISGGAIPTSSFTGDGALRTASTENGTPVALGTFVIPLNGTTSNAIPMDSGAWNVLVRAATILDDKARLGTELISIQVSANAAPADPADWYTVQLNVLASTVGNGASLTVPSLNGASWFVRVVSSQAVAAARTFRVIAAQQT